MKSLFAAVFVALLLALVARNNAHPLLTRRYILQKRLDGCPCNVQLGGYAKVPSMISVEIILVTEYKHWVANGHPVRPAKTTKVDQGFCMEASMKASGDYVILMGSDHEDDSAHINDAERPPCKAVSIVDFNENYDVDECDSEDSDEKSANIELPVTQRIVNGSFVTKEKVGRYNVFIDHRRDPLSNKDHDFCSGSLIGEQWVLTAAHCNVDKGDDVIVGRHEGAEGEKIKVIETISHENYKEIDHAEVNDIQLLKLEHKPEKAAEHIIAVNTDCRRPVPCRFAQVSGYGRATASNSTAVEGMCGAYMLRSTFVKVVSDGECHERLRSFGAYLGDDELDLSPHICAVHDACGSGTCLGDSGGPLVVADGDDDDDDTLVQIGITSYHFGSCAARRHPDVYTRLSDYAVWINKNTNGEAKMNPDFDERVESCPRKKPSAANQKVINPAELDCGDDCDFHPDKRPKPIVGP